MKLRFLAISDTHLGENTSLLTFPQGRKYLLETLLDKFGNDEIEELILVGDVGDTALASISQVITHTSAFIQTLLGSLDIKKIIYIPGNHDHTLWTDYRKTRPPGVSNPHVTDPGGELLVERSEKKCPGDCDFLLTLFFEYDYGPAWAKIQEDKLHHKFFDFAIANPLYAVEEFGRTYVFTHGTHFKSIVTAPKWIKKVVDSVELDELLVGIDIDSNCDVNNAHTLEELEKEVSSFVDSLWISSKNNPTSRSDQLWYLYNVLSGHFGEHRNAPLDNELKSYPNIASDRINHLDRGNSSIDLMLKHFFSHLINYLSGMQTSKLTFVYGDTHDGGFGEITENRVNMRIYNCGSWVVHHEDDHPPCHVFAVDDNGKEYMLDISFKDEKIQDTPIIELAAADFENRERAISRIVRWLLRSFG